MKIYTHLNIKEKGNKSYAMKIKAKLTFLDKYKIKESESNQSVGSPAFFIVTNTRI